MVLIIFEVSSLAFRMSDMEDVSSDMDLDAVRTLSPASFIKTCAWPELLAFCLVMEDISSSEEEVSLMEAVCSEEPSAKVWLAEDTSPAAEAT